MIDVIRYFTKLCQANYVNSMKKNKSKLKIINIEDLFTFFGGSIEIALKLGKHQHTIERWKKLGIPEKHYDFLASETGLTVGEIYLVSRTAERYN